MKFSVYFFMVIKRISCLCVRLRTHMGNQIWIFVLVDMNYLFCIA